MTAVKALDMSGSELGKWGEAYENHKGQEFWIAAEDNYVGKKVVKTTVNTINYKQLAGLKTPTKHSEEDIQTKRVEKEARSQNMAKKAHSCGISVSGRKKISAAAKAE